MLNRENTSKWFENYVSTFEKDGRLPDMLSLKHAHSKRVAELCEEIRDSMGWNEIGDEWLAHAVGLLHDVGRFPQYQRYGTFEDRASVDHGNLSAQVLSEKFDWGGISEVFKDTVLTAVKYHNKLEVPTELPLYTFRWASMVRDADKMDIFAMVQKRLDNGTIDKMLPRHTNAPQGLTPALVAEIRKNARGSYANAHSLQDFRLIQLTWGCDLNYPVSVVTLKSYHIFERICADLKGQGIDDLLDSLMAKIDSI